MKQETLPCGLESSVPLSRQNCQPSPLMRSSFAFRHRHPGSECMERSCPLENNGKPQHAPGLAIPSYTFLNHRVLRTMVSSSVSFLGLQTELKRSDPFLEDNVRPSDVLPSFSIHSYVFPNIFCHVTWCCPRFLS